MKGVTLALIQTTMKGEWQSGPPAHRRVPVVHLMLALPYGIGGLDHVAIGNRAATLHQTLPQEALANPFVGKL